MLVLLVVVVVGALLLEVAAASGDNSGTGARRLCRRVPVPVALSAHPKNLKT